MPLATASPSLLKKRFEEAVVMKNNESFCTLVTFAYLSDINGLRRFIDLEKVERLASSQEFVHQWLAIQFLFNIWGGHGSSPAPKQLFLEPYQEIISGNKWLDDQYIQEMIESLRRGLAKELSSDWQRSNR